MSDYSKVRAIGSGTMATVYEGTDDKLGRRVAIKELSPKLLHSSGFVGVFLDEARRIAAISHPNILPIFAVDESHDSPWLITELADGSLAQESQQQASPDHAARVLRQILLGLTEIHDQGLVHRNIKPSNILRCGGAYKLGDFGVEAKDATIPYSTPRYMSPEGLSDPTQLGAASDLYSLGMVMYELLLGEARFVETVARAAAQETAGAAAKGDQLWFQFHMAGAELPELHTLDPNIPEDLSGVIANMVKKNPEERFATCADVLVNLDGIIQGTGKVEGESFWSRLSLAARVGLAAGGTLLLLLVFLLVLGGRPRVDVASEPPGATLWVEGEMVGRTPVERLRIKPGTELTLRKPGYLETSVTWETREQRKLAIELDPRIVSLESIPSGAGVHIEGKEIGTTPAQLEAVAEGTEITFRLEGFATETVTLGHEETEISVELKIGKGQISTDPAAMIADLLRWTSKSAGLSITLRARGASGHRVPVGIPISFEISSQEAAHLAVFTVGWDGTINCLYPNQTRSVLELGARATAVVPLEEDRAAGFSLESDVPYGVDRVFVLASPTPLAAMPLTTSSTAWLSSYSFLRGPPAGNPAAGFYFWVVRLLEASSADVKLAVFEMEVIR